METILFLVFGILAVVAGIAVITFRNPIYSALALIMTFSSQAGLFILLGAHFVAVVQIIVYAGAIMVLFLFVIMLLDVKEEERRRFQKFGTFLGFAAVAGLGAIIINTIGQSAIGEAFKEKGAGETKTLGKLLFTKYVLPFEIISVLLLVAMVGCILLSKRDEPKEADAE